MKFQELLLPEVPCDFVDRLFSLSCDLNHRGNNFADASLQLAIVSDG